nr:hypothetical protein Iba_chr09bCG5670 [Ipomoea batatas]
MEARFMGALSRLGICAIFRFLLFSPVSFVLNSLFSAHLFACTTAYAGFRFGSSLSASATVDEELASNGVWGRKEKEGSPAFAGLSSRGSSCGHLMLLGFSLTDPNIFDRYPPLSTSGLADELRPQEVPLPSWKLELRIFISPFFPSLADRTVRECLMSLIIPSAIGKPQSFIDLAMAIESSKSSACKKSPTDGSFATNFTMSAKLSAISTKPSVVENSCIFLKDNGSSSLVLKLSAQDIKGCTSLGKVPEASEIGLRLEVLEEANDFAF